jgi:hypothetical protein
MFVQNVLSKKEEKNFEKKDEKACGDVVQTNVIIFAPLSLLLETFEHSAYLHLSVRFFCLKKFEHSTYYSMFEFF